MTTAAERYIKNQCPNFSVSENWGDLSLLATIVPGQLQNARTKYGAPIQILDAAHPRPNRPGSMHNKGLAADFAPMGHDILQHMSELLRLYYIVAAINPPGLGFYPLGSSGFGFLHMDFRPNTFARWTAYCCDDPTNGTDWVYFQGINIWKVLQTMCNTARLHGAYDDITSKS